MPVPPESNGSLPGSKMGLAGKATILGMEVSLEGAVGLKRKQPDDRRWAGKHRGLLRKTPPVDAPPSVHRPAAKAESAQAPTLAQRRTRQRTSGSPGTTLKSSSRSQS